VHIGEQSVVRAATVGSYVHIGVGYQHPPSLARLCLCHVLYVVLKQTARPPEVVQGPPETESFLLENLRSDRIVLSSHLPVRSTKTVIHFYQA